MNRIIHRWIAGGMAVLLSQGSAYHFRTDVRLSLSFDESFASQAMSPVGESFVEPPLGRSPSRFARWLGIAKRAGVAWGVRLRFFKPMAIEDWMLDVFAPHVEALAKRVERGQIEAHEVREFIKTIMSPIAPDFRTHALPKNNEPVEVYRIQDLGDEILEYVMIPRKFYFSRSIDGLDIAYGHIVNSQRVTTAAGRQVPLYDVNLIAGDLGFAMAGARHIVRSLQGRKILEDVVTAARGSALSLLPGLGLMPLFLPDPAQMTAWVMNHVNRARTTEEAINVLQRTNLEEELSHSDAHAYIEALLNVPAVNLEAPHRAYRAARALLKDGSELLQKLDQARGKPDEIHVARAIIETEAKLNGMRRALVPSYVFLEFFTPEISGQKGADYYDESYQMLRGLLAKPLTQKPNPGTRGWLKALQRLMANMDDFDQLLVKAGNLAYPTQFLSLEERESKLQQAS
jgi:hypothetical protein